ncbi:MAG: DUF4364 family protein [Clostridia bacterium]|nr:DUF4364 family protein [Clostridia bacterium]
MQGPLKDKNDIKIFILYLLRNIGYPLDFDNINDIVVQDGVVGYFDFADCFAELLDTGNIAEEKNGRECLYRITDQGIHVADNLQSNILTAIRERSLKSALRLLSFKKKGSRIQHHSEPLENGGYTLTCSIVEERQEIMRVSVFLDNKAQLDKMEYNFENNPEVVYRGVLALLSGEINYLVN